MASHITTLSIFIILLAFFIALNSLANFAPEKATPILESLKQTFGTKEDDADLKPSLREDPVQASSQGDILEELEDLFRSRIEGVEAVSIQGRSALLLRMPMANFEKALDEEIRADEELSSSESQEGNQEERGTQDFLPALKTMVTTGRQGTQYRVRMTANVPAQSNVTSPPNSSLPKRISQLAGKVEAIGIPKPLLGIGIQKGPVDTIDLVFTPYAPFVPDIEAMPELGESAQAPDKDNGAGTAPDEQTVSPEEVEQETFDE